MKHLLLTTVFVLASAACVAACAKTESKKTMKSEQTDKRVLVAYFSRAGENYGVGNITKGNTKIVAELIAGETGGELFEIVPQNAYPHEYDPCTEVAKNEKEGNERPAIKEDKDISDYDIIFIGYPIWWGDAPMPVYTWIERHQWKGKTVIPFCTHEGSGLGTSGENICKSCSGATRLEGFELNGTTAQKRQNQAQKAVSNWIKQLNL